MAESKTNPRFTGKVPSVTPRENSVRSLDRGTLVIGKNAILKIKPSVRTVKA